jgi:hypothetical protein
LLCWRFCIAAATQNSGGSAPAGEPACLRPPLLPFLRLRAYIAERMRMSHIYQPLMLMELLGRSSPAPAQDVARRILG